MFKKPLFVLVIVLALLVAMIGGNLAQDDDPIIIGIITDQTSGLAIYGYELEYGFKLGLLFEAGIDPSDFETIDEALAAVRVAGRPVQLIVVNYENDIDRAVNLARELVEVRGAEFLVGAPSSGATVALQQVALDNEVLLFAAPGASPAITGSNFNLNTFRLCRNSFQDSAALGRLSATVGDRWMILAADYEFGRASAGAFEFTLPAYGVNFIQPTIYAPLETTDFTPYLQQVLDASPDALIAVWAGDGAIPLFQQITELGVSDRVAIVGGTNSNDIAAVSTTPDQIGQFGFIVYHYTLPNNPINDWLIEKHMEFFPHPATGAVDYPDLFTECSFATAQALVKAVEAAGGATLPEDLIPHLEGMIFESAKGTIYIRPSDHQALVPMYLIQIDNIDDPAFRFYTLLEEISAFDSAPPCLLEGEFASRCEMDAEFMALVAEMEGAGE